MTEYPYEYDSARSVTNGKWDVDNPDRTDAEGKQLPLAREIETAFPGKMFLVRCNGTILKVLFEIELTAGEQTTLNTLITDHKNNAA